MEEPSIREHHHIQMNPWQFHSNTYAPVATSKGGTGKTRFSVESSIYFSAVGRDAVDPMNSGNEFMISFRDYVRMKELMGYEHIGLSSREITKMLENLWGKKLG